MHRIQQIVDHTRKFSTSLDHLLSPPSLEPLKNELIIKWSALTRVLHIELNRPQKLNALSGRQVKYLSGLLAAIHETQIERCGAVLVTGNSKAFCAGGDIKSLATSTDIKSACREFFAYEYCFDFWTKHLGRPYISIWQGIVFGGGVGMSVHGDYRIATESTIFAMPETAIGLFPDIGMSYLLSRMPDGLGLFIGMTGARLNGADLIHLRLATHFVANTGTLVDKLNGNAEVKCAVNAEMIESILKSVSTSPNVEPLLNKHICEEVKKFFGGVNSLDELVGRLTQGIQDGNKFAEETMKVMETMCPLSCAIWFELHSRASSLSLKECFDLDYKLCQAVCLDDPGMNFKEGVRALLVDRTKDPKWNPKSFKEIDQDLQKAKHLVNVH